MVLSNPELHFYTILTVWRRSSRAVTLPRSSGTRRPQCSGRRRIVCIFRVCVHAKVYALSGERLLKQDKTCTFSNSNDVHLKERCSGLALRGYSPSRSRTRAQRSLDNAEPRSSPPRSSSACKARARLKSASRPSQNPVHFD